MIITILIFILIILVLLILKNNEKFQNFGNIFLNKSRYLNESQACTALKDIKELNNYSIPNCKLRNIDKEKYNQICDFYCDNLISFTKYDKLVIDWVMEKLLEKTPDELKFIYNDVKYAKYEDGIENNFPHTHKNIIFVTSKFLDRAYYYYQKKDVDEMIKNFGVIIIHECVHIWQRKDQELFYKLYIYYWNFIKVNKIYNNHVKENIRFNPDGKDCNWIYSYKNKHIMFASLYKEDARNIGDVDNVGIFLDKHNISFIMPNEDVVIIKNLGDIEEYNDFFKHVSSNNYHPNELSAELISIYYLKKMGLSHNRFTNKAMYKLERWFLKNVARKN